jgi:hypothetical protein
MEGGKKGGRRKGKISIIYPALSLDITTRGIIVNGNG